MTTSTTPTLEARAERLRTFAAEGRILRGQWQDERAGREFACLLSAWSPEAGAARSADACPADALPPWLAYLLPWMDDEGSEAEWPRMIERVVAILPRIHTLSADTLHRLDYTARRAAVVEARTHTAEGSDAREACERVIALCDRVTQGAEPTADEWDVARAAERVAARATPWAAAGDSARDAAMAAAGDAAWVAAGDRITDEILTAIEEALTDV